MRFSLVVPTLVLGIVPACDRGRDVMGAYEGAQKMRIEALETKVAALDERLSAIEGSGVFDNDSDASRLLKRIQDMGSGRYTEAGLLMMTDYLRRFSLSSDMPWVLHEAIAAAIRIKKVSVGENLLTEMTERCGETFAIRREVGALLLTSSRYEEALALYESLAVDLENADIERIEAEFYRGYTLMQWGRLQAAIDAFEALQEKWREYPDIRAQAFIASSGYEAKTARDWLDQGLGEQ